MEPRILEHSSHRLCVFGMYGVARILSGSSSVGECPEFVEKEKMGNDASRVSGPDLGYGGTTGLVMSVERILEYPLEMTTVIRTHSPTDRKSVV